MNISPMRNKKIDNLVLSIIIDENKTIDILSMITFSKNFTYF